MRFISLFFSTLAMTIAPLITQAEEIVVRTPHGETISVEYQLDESFGEILSRIEHAINSVDETNENPQSYFIDFMKRLPPESRNPSTTRDYYALTTHAESEIIRKIVTMLAGSSWPDLWKNRNKLRDYGEDIDHLHPFRFLMTIFMDNEMRSGVHTIKDRGGKIWKEFTKGLYTTLTAEAAKNNVEPHIDDFARQMRVDASKIRKPLQEKNWKEFAEVLLKEIPRGGDPNRYDM